MAKHKHQSVSEQDLPALGFIIPGVAAGFLRLAEGNVAIFDSLVSNPLVSSATRHRAMDALFAHIKLRAEDLGFTRLIGFTVDVGASERAKRHGFKQIQHMILAYSKE